LTVRAVSAFRTLTGLDIDVFERNLRGYGVNAVARATVERAWLLPNRVRRVDLEVLERGVLREIVRPDPTYSCDCASSPPWMMTWWPAAV